MSYPTGERVAKEGCGCCGPSNGAYYHVEPTEEQLKCCMHIRNISHTNYHKFASFDFKAIFSHLDARYSMDDKISPECFRYMIEHAVNLDSAICYTRPIHAIAYHGTSEMIELMVKKGVDLISRGSYDGGITQTGFDPVTAMCANYTHPLEPATIMRLIDLGVNFDFEYSYNRRPITLLCKHSNFTVECLAYMISKGVKYDFVDELDESPVLSALCHFNFPIAAFLIDDLHVNPPSYERVTKYWSNMCIYLSDSKKSDVQKFLELRKKTD